MLPQARLPQPTVFDGTTPPFQECIQETRNFLSINNYEFVRQMDYALQSDTEVSLQMVANSTRIGRIRRDAMDANERAQDDLHRENEIPLLERAAGRTDAAIEAELDVLRNAHVPLERDYEEWVDRVERGGDYLNYILIHGTKLGTEANNYVRRLQRSTNGFEALRLLRLRHSVTKLPVATWTTQPKVHRSTTTFPVPTMARVFEPLRTRSTTTTRWQSQNSNIGQWTTRQSTTTLVAVGQADIHMAKCERDSRELLQFDLCS